MTAAASTIDTDTGAARLALQLAADRAHSTAELVEILTHNAAVTACADYRNLQAAAAIYEDLDHTYMATVDEALGCGPVTSIEELAARALTAAEIRDRFGPDGLEQAIALFGAALTVPAARARRLIIAGTVMCTQLPRTGTLLACGRIDLTRMLLIIDRTTLVHPDRFEALDADLAVELGTRAPMSIRRFRDLVDTIIFRVDRDAARLHRERGDHDRHVVIRPDHTIPGQSRITGTLPAARAAALNARLDTMAAAVHHDDGRTVAQRRADALIALAHDEPALTCRCPTCTPSTAVPSAAEGPTSRSGPAECPDRTATTAPGSPGEYATADCAEGRSAADARPSTLRPASPTAPKPTFHIIVSLATLLGANDSPAYLDGHGVINPNIARELVTEATRSYIHTPHTPALPPGSPPRTIHPGTPEPPATPSAAPTPGSNRYVPSRSVRALTTAAELCCTFPGCTTPVHRTDLDHTTPHAAGGTTTPTNLKPLCRPHHRIKTFTPGWSDYQTPLGHIFFTTPTGHTFLGNAFTGRDIFTELRPPRAPNITPAHTRVINLRAVRSRAHHRARERYDAAHPPPF